MFDRVRRHFPARLVGETVAAVHGTRGLAGTVVRMWMASPPHRAIVLGPSFRRMGVGGRRGFLQADRAMYVTADFAGALNGRAAEGRRAAGGAGAGRPGGRGLPWTVVARRDLTHPLVPTLAAAALGAVYLIAAPDTADMAAHTYRTWLWHQVGFATWNAQWYGGHHMAGYSLLYPPLAAVAGTRFVGVAAAVVAVWLFARLAHRRAATPPVGALAGLAVPRRRDEQRGDRAHAVHARARARRRRLGVRAALAVGRRGALAAVRLGQPRVRRLPRRRGRRGARGRAPARGGAAAPRRLAHRRRARRARPSRAGWPWRCSSPRAARTTSSAARVLAHAARLHRRAGARRPAPAHRAVGGRAVRRRAGGRLRVARTRSGRPRCGPGRCSGRRCSSCSPGRARPALAIAVVAGILLYLQWLPAVRAVEEARGDPSTAAAFHAEVLALPGRHARPGRAPRGAADAQPLGGHLPGALLSPRARLAPPARPQGRPALLRARARSRPRATRRGCATTPSAGWRCPTRRWTSPRARSAGCC